MNPKIFICREAAKFKFGVTLQFLLNVWLPPEECLVEALSINQSKRIYIAPYVAGESEARQDNERHFTDLLSLLLLLLLLVF